ncbi:hypothetical protein [Streptomyces sp. NPDC001312]|uniref:hypothetical protein n=1 Tax=Streptomyces sp. NPDC001312 TaxID=3364561 RepID=UPI00368BF042
MYSGALADMGLGVDPYTGNRYACTGGNPVSLLELDGHCPHDACDWLDTSKTSSSAAEEFTKPGEGEFYENDTPLDAPEQQKKDNRPFNTSNWFTQWWNHEFNMSGWTYLKAGVQGLRHYMGYDVAADLLDHWLGASGDAYQLDPKRMMDDMPSFQKLVDGQVAKAKKSGGNYDSGWSVSTSVADFIDARDKRAAVQGWWYAPNGFQYRVKSGSGNKTITVEIFKRYNWGNPAGGAPRGNVGLFEEVDQNALAQLHTDGFAQDFNVWGSYSYPVGG